VFSVSANKACDSSASMPCNPWSHSIISQLRPSSWIPKWILFSPLPRQLFLVPSTIAVT
jgi:hypothetical protein